MLGYIPRTYRSSPLKHTVTCYSARNLPRNVELGYEHGKALNVATYFEIDDVVDPADTRHRIVEMLRAAPPPDRRPGERRPMVDTW